MCQSQLIELIFVAKKCKTYIDRFPRSWVSFAVTCLQIPNFFLGGFKIWVHQSASFRISRSQHNWMIWFANISGWWQLKDFLCSPLYIWGRWTQFDEHIFQRGWNHQPDLWWMTTFFRCIRRLGKWMGIEWMLWHRIAENWGFLTSFVNAAMLHPVLFGHHKEKPITSMGRKIYVPNMDPIKVKQIHLGKYFWCIHGLTVMGSRMFFGWTQYGQVGQHFIWLQRMAWRRQCVFFFPWAFPGTRSGTWRVLRVFIAACSPKKR